MSENDKKHESTVDIALNPVPVKKPKKEYLFENSTVPIVKQKPVPKGFWAKRKYESYKNKRYGRKGQRHLPTMYLNGDLDFEESMDFAAMVVHAKRLQSDPSYRRQMQNDDMVERMADNNAALLGHTISQAMTWLVPRLERDFSDILRELKDE